MISNICYCRARKESTGGDQHPAATTDLEQSSDSSVWPLTSTSLDYDSDLTNSNDSETEYSDMHCHSDPPEPSENSELNLTPYNSTTSVQQSDSGKRVPAGKSTNTPVNI